MISKMMRVEYKRKKMFIIIYKWQLLQILQDQQ